MSRATGWAFLLLLVGVAALPIPHPAAGRAEPGAPTPAASFSLRSEDGLYSLKATDALLTDILREVGRTARIRVQMDPNLTRRVTLDVRGIPLEKLLETLAASHAFVYSRSAEGDQLISAALTSQEEGSPAPAPQPLEAASREAAERGQLLKRGVLLNSGRPVHDLLRRGAAAILLENAMIDTDAARATGRSVEVPADFAAPDGTEHYIVQFDHALSAQDRLSLEDLGAAIHHYVPNSALAVSVPAERADDLRALPGVSYCEPYHPYYKMSRDVLAYFRGDAGAETSERVERGLFTVAMFDGQDGAADLEQAGASVVRREAIGSRVSYVVRCAPDALRRVLRSEPVQWVEPSVPNTAMNDKGNRGSRVSALKAVHPSLNGAGVVVGVTDTGIDFTNPAFAADQNQATSTNLNTRIAYYEARPSLTSDGVPGDAEGHGTHVSGSILGNGARSASVLSAPGTAKPYGTNAFAGAAPAARVVMIEDFNSFTDQEQAETSYRQGARISNNSWGNTLFQYGEMSARWDALVRDADSSEAGDQPYIVFFAAGNSGYGNKEGTGGFAGTIGQPGNAKNVITVGAMEQARFADNLLAYDSVKQTDSDWQIAYFSSRGPVSLTDARVKPDVVAPGSYVLSVQSRETDPDVVEDPPLPNQDYRHGNLDSGSNYAFFSGTSMATPLSAGAAALVFQYYSNTFEKAASPALMKAILVNGARMVNEGQYRYPPIGIPPTIVDQGWGAVDVSRAVDGPGIFDSESVLWLDQDETAPLATAQVYQREYSIILREGGLKVTLAWTDPPGTPGNLVQLVNDLDLTVIGPDGAGYVGNFFDLDGLTSYKIPSFDAGDFTNLFSVYNFDRLNNVEQVVIPDAAPGVYTIRVEGAQVPEGPQDFALAITKGVQDLAGHMAGYDPAMALDADGAPVLAYSGPDEAGQRQIYVRRWIGPAGGQDEIGLWKRLEDRWFDIEDSARETGISKSIEDSTRPSVALFGTNIYVAWQEAGATTNLPSHIYLKHFNGTGWAELDNSGRANGVSQNGDYSATDPVVRVGSDGQPVVCWVKFVQEGSFPFTFAYRAFVAKWSGTNWAGLGASYSSGIPGGQFAARPDLVIDTSNRVVVAWEEPTLARIYVRRWNGASWENVGDLGGSPHAGFPKLAAGDSNSLYLTWIQQPDVGAGQLYPQVFAAKRTSGSWQTMAGSLTYPGITAASNAATVPYRSSIAVTPERQVLVAWQADSNAPNAIYLKRYDGGTTWVGVANSDRHPGVSLSGGLSSKPVVLANRPDSPVVAFQTVQGSNSEVMVYRVVTDETPPGFDGLRTAVGGTNGNVFLSWLPASDFSPDIVYTIFRSLISFACGTLPTCTAADVFGNPVATVTNLTSYEVLGLTNDQVYCFGVRAADTNGLSENNTVIRSAGPTDPGGDADGDCLVYSNEFAAGTEPCLKDTDGDGMWDGWEWLYSTNNPAHAGSLAMDPVDSGYDNIRTVELNDGDPAQRPTEDLDNDGVSNFEEFELWYQDYLVNGCAAAGPDPTDSDTDNDGIPDGWEIINGLDPLNPADAAFDLDGDGLSNADEYARGTDPRSPDSDSDGLMDGDEVTAGTDPAQADSDHDGLDDGEDPDPRDAESLTSGIGDGDVYQLGYSGPAPSVFASFFRETFEASSTTVTGWTHYAFVSSDPWHLSTAEPAPPSGSISYLHERTTNRAYRAANDPTGTNAAATYAYGSSVLRAVLISPNVDAFASPNLFLAWNEFVATEANRDLCTVQGRGGSDSNWYLVNNPASGLGTGWVHRVADFSRFAGRSNVQVRFLFSADNKNNSFAGWYVDDVWMYAGASITGWVRDVNGRPIVGTKVLALGRGGITNAVSGHKYVLPGRIFGEATTASDGSYRLVGLPQGRFYVKAADPNHRDEFFDGALYSNTYGFGNGQYPGVYARDLVSSRGWVDLTAAGSTTNCDFELERGVGRTYLGVALSNPGAVQYDVLLNGGVTGLEARIWNGSTATPALETYRTFTSLPIANNFPDWISNAVRPNLVGDAAPGDHLVFAGTDLVPYAPPETGLREGETTLVNIFTNQGEGRLYVKTHDGSRYPVWLNGRPTTNLTPAVLGVKAGQHRVMIQITNFTFRVAPKVAAVPLGRRAVVEFSSNDMAGVAGSLCIRTLDLFGNELTGAVVYVNGQRVTAGEVAAGWSLDTPTCLNQLKPGGHTVAVRKDGYRIPEFRSAPVTAGVSNTVTFVLYQTDLDYDAVGDWTEISGYGDIFLYDSDDDPDGDGLNNRFEFEQFRLYGVSMNTFNGDTDGDGMEDGAELGFDGRTNALALSTLYTNALQGASEVRALFAGRYLDGFNNFGSGNIAAAIDCDLFEANGVHVTAPPAPSILPALVVFTGIPPSVVERSVSQTHISGATVLADTLPDQQDTDGDGMWDGFEAAYGDGVNLLNPLECGHADEDPDGDGLSNYLEFLGPDGVANTNDWTHPGLDDTDGDGMPDGWEITYGLDPFDPDDAALDPDDDGLTNLDEYHFDANPWLQDTDGDGLYDGEEVATFGTNPKLRDTDNDGLLDGQEVWDRDGDGVYDGGFFAGCPLYWIAPLTWDTDGDGMPDGFEVIDGFGDARDPALDPCDDSDGIRDDDGDGLSNLEEYRVATDDPPGHHPSSFDPALGYVVWDYTTDPFDADSDDDGMPDGWEVENGLHPMDPIPCGAGCTFTRYGDLAVDGDVDHDGLWNQREFGIRFLDDPNANSNSIAGPSSSPWNPDTDADGLVDGEEDRAFRCSPVLEDSDRDRLKDGSDPAWWGEVNTESPPTNHFDRALNDLWRFVWPATDGLPHWEPVIPASTNAPAARWGAAATYIPVFESVAPCCRPDFVQLDNRQVVIFGGRDGVQRFGDIWEYVVASNAWVRSVTNMTGYASVANMSELSAVTLYGYFNLGGCGPADPYCLLPNGARPTGNKGYGRSSFDWTYLLGGWDEGYAYQLPEPMEAFYYKGQDRTKNEIDLGPDIAVLEVRVTSSTSLYYSARDSMYGHEPFGQQTEESDLDTTNTYLGLNAMRYSAISDLALDCAEFENAWLIFEFDDPLPAPVTYGVFAEMDQRGTSPLPYGNVRERFAINGWYFNSSVLPFTIPAGAMSYTVEVSSIVSEVILNPIWDGTNMGFVVDSAASLLPSGGNPSNNAALFNDSTILRIRSRPFWVADAYWQQGFQPQPVGEMPSRRKSLGMVYDCRRDRILAFGGMDGRQVFGDTYEGTPLWYNFVSGGCVTNGLVGTPCVILWNRLTDTGANPPARWGHSMVFDPFDRRILMFGGFDSLHNPLNDLWAFKDGQWSEVKGLLDGQKPPPRGGASMAFFGNYCYDRGLDLYCVGDNSNHMNKVVLFGGTDGRVYFNDTWVFDEHYASETVPVAGRRWLLVSPNGEMSQSNGPSPRAFASAVYAQNGRYSPDENGLSTFIMEDTAVSCIRIAKCASPAVYLFGGRAGTLPTSGDSDDDLVDDGTEYELGGPAAGRDPRLNALVHTNAGETIPFSIKRIGPIASNRVRGAIANFESLSYPSYDERLKATDTGLPFEGHPSGGLIGDDIFVMGADAFSHEMTPLWYHRASAGEDVWELGEPDNSSIGAQGAPPYAYSGRWCYGTDLNGRYPTNAVLELYSPLFGLHLPSGDSTSTNFNRFYLLFHEWLNLKDSNDVVRVEVIRPKTAADIAQRRPGVGTTPVRIVSERNYAYNTTGTWRRVVAPLDDVANETNLYVRFVLQSDAKGVAGGWYIDDVAIVQGGMISGSITNVSGVEVVLLGEIYNGQVQAKTVTQGGGYFRFDLLPFGHYQLGAVNSVFGPFNLSPTSTAVSSGETNVASVVITSISYGMPTSVTWPTAPGLTYRIEWAPAIFGPWTELDTLVAAGLQETYLDYNDGPLRFYRVLYVSAP